MTHDYWIMTILAVSTFVGGGFCIAAALWWDDLF
jgi:hypothetical protein